MDAKITKKRLTALLSYDWFKIVALILGVCVFWALIFTMTATRITSAQQFTVFNHYANGSLTTNFSDFYGNSITNGIYSHEVLDLTTNDLVTAGTSYSEILQARLSVEEGDIMFLPDIGDEDRKVTNEDGSVSYPYTYVDSFMRSGYGYSLIDLNQYMNDLTEFLETYYTDINDGESLNKELVETTFRTRIKANKDKRYKKEDQIQAGVQGEFERMEKYRLAYLKVNEYMASGLITPRTVTYVDESTGKTIFDGVYAWNICPDESKNTGMKNYMYYRVTNDKGVSIPTAQNMCVMFFDFTVGVEGYQFENLLFLTQLMERTLAVTA